MHVEAEVVDLSLGGFAVKASLRLANRLNVGDPLFLQARLPGATLQHSLEARVRHVEVNPDPQRACAVLGLETILGPESPPAWSREIQRFVMDRQREIAKRYAETRLRRRS
jgi:c-di-GMP-binding flagellar brake protein YcgR